MKTFELVEDYGEYKVFNNGTGESLSLDCSMDDYVELGLDSTDVTNYVRFSLEEVRGMTELFSKTLIEWENKSR